MKKIFLCGVLALFLGLGIAGCATTPSEPENPGGSENPPPTATDTTAPIVTVNLTKGIVNQKLAFTYTATDDATASAELETKVALTKGGAAVEYDTDNSFYATAAGEYIVTVTAKDKAGNVGKGEAKVTVDEVGSFTIDGGADVGVTISGDKKTLSISDAYVDGAEVVPTSEYAVDGLQTAGSFQLDYSVSGLLYDDGETATVHPKLFVNLRNAGGSTDVLWLDALDAAFGAYNITGEEIALSGRQGGIDPLPEGEEKNSVSVVRLVKGEAVWYGVAYNGALVDVFRKETDFCDLIDLVTFKAESMAVDVSDVRLTDFAINPKTDALKALENYVWEIENTQFDREDTVNADFSGEFAETPEIVLEQEAYSFAYFKNAVGKYYLFEATLSNERANQGGLIYASYGSTSYALFTDGHNGSGAEYTNASVWMSLVVNGTTISWPFENQGSYELRKAYDATAANKIAVVRDDATFYYFVNDAFLGRRTIEALAGKEVRIGFGNNVDRSHVTEWTVKETETSAGLDALHEGFAAVREEYENTAFDRDGASGADFADEFSETPEITVSGGGFRYAFFKETAGIYYAFTAKMASDGNQMGLVYATLGNISYALFTDAGNGGNRSSASVMMSLVVNGTTINYPHKNGSKEYYFAAENEYDATKEMTITVVRENTYFYYFLNGKYLGMREIPELDGLDVRLALASSTTTTYTEWSVTETADAKALEALVDGLEAARASQFGLTRQSVVQDGSDLVITTEQGRLGYAFFKENYGTSYHLHTKFTNSKNNNAGGKRGGVFFAYNESTNTKYAVITDNNAAPCTTIILAKIPGNAISWPFQNAGSFEMFALYNGASDISIDVIRDNTKFYILIDGNCVTFWELPEFDGLSTKVALASNENTITRFKEYSVTEENVTVPTGFKLNSVFNGNAKSGNGQYAYYGYQKAGLYYEFSADVQVSADGSGQAGLLYALDGESGSNSTTARYAFCLDAGNGSDTARALMGIRMINPNYAWPATCTAATCEHRIAYKRTDVVNLKIIRDNDKFYVYANDQFVTVMHIASMKDKPTHIGFTTRNETVTFDNVTLVEHETPVDCTADFIKTSYTVTGGTTSQSMAPSSADVKLVSTGTVTVSAKLSGFQTTGTSSFKIAVDFIAARADNSTRYSDRLGLDISMNSGVYCIDNTWKNAPAFGSKFFDTDNPPESVTIKVRRAIVGTKAVYTLWIDGQEIDFSARPAESAFVGPIKGIKFAVQNMNMTVSDVVVELE